MMEVVKLPEINRLDRAEAILVAAGGVIRPKGGSIQGLPYRHVFTPGMFVREVSVPAGVILTTHTHRTEHPFVLSKGKVSVFSEEDGSRYLEAPFMGVTKIGTRRIVYHHEDTIWTTFHATELTDIDEIEEWLYEPITNPLLDPAVMIRNALQSGG